MSLPATSSKSPPRLLITPPGGAAWHACNFSEELLLKSDGIYYDSVT